jgi:hypothetical protein
MGISTIEGCACSGNKKVISREDSVPGTNRPAIGGSGVPSLPTSLARHRHASGTYTLGWDGGDEMGAPLASGAYIIRMRGPDINSARTVQLLR